MAAVSTYASTGGSSVTSLTTGNVTPGGANRTAISAACSYSIAANDAKYGGSGGTTMPALGASQSVTFFNVYLTTWAVAGSPASSTNGYHGFPSSADNASTIIVFLEGVDQTTPFGSEQTSNDYGSSTGTAVAEKVLSGLTPGQTVVGIIGVSALGGLTSVASNNAATTVLPYTGNGFVAVVAMHGVADGSGNLTLSALITETSTNLISWWVSAFAVNDAASSGTTVNPGAGSVVISGQTPVALRADFAQPAQGAVTIVGQLPVALRGTIPQPGAGSVVITGLAPTTLTNTFAQPGAGAVTITGLAPTVLANTTVSPGAGSISISGQAPAVITGGSVVAQPGAGSITISGLAPSLLANTFAQPGVGAITISGQAPVALRGTVVQPGAGAITFSGAAPAVLANIIVQPGAGAITITGQEPSLAGAVTATPDAGSVVITGYAPTVINTSSGDIASDPKFMGRGKNVKFKPLKREPASQEIVPPEITNIEHVKPPKRTRTLLDMLDDLPPEPLAPPLPPAPPKAAPKPAAPPAPPSAEPVVEPAPPPPAAPPVQPVATLESVQALAATLKATQDQLAAMAAQLAEATATIQSMASVQVEVRQEVVGVRTEAQKRDDKAAQRARNAKRAREIAERLLRH